MKNLGNPQSQEMLISAQAQSALHHTGTGQVLSHSGIVQAHEQVIPAQSYPFGTGAYSKEFLDYTIAFHLKYSQTPLSYEEAAEIVHNVLELYDVLEEIDIQEMSEKNGVQNSEK